MKLWPWRGRTTIPAMPMAKEAIVLSIQTVRRFRRQGSRLCAGDVSDRRLRRGQIATIAIAILFAAAWPESALAAPANDDFADARPLTSEMTGSMTGSNVGATKEIGEPDHAGNPGGHSVWDSWIAPSSGNVAFSTEGSAFDTLLAVYTGAAVNSLTPIAANDDDPIAFTAGWSTVSFAVSNGVTYMVAVDGFSGKQGFLALLWHRAPANDNFADAQVLASTTSGQATGTALGATLEPGEPLHFDVESGATIWYDILDRHLALRGRWRSSGLALVPARPRHEPGRDPTRNVWQRGDPGNGRQRQPPWSRR